MARIWQNLQKKDSLPPKIVEELSWTKDNYRPTPVPGQLRGRVCNSVWKKDSAMKIIFGFIKLKNCMIRKT